MALMSGSVAGDEWLDGLVHGREERGESCVNEVLKYFTLALTVKFFYMFLA